MGHLFGDRISRGEISRRDFLWLLSALSSGVVLPSMSGCATHPVTGQSVLVGMSEEQEIALDRQYSVQQFSQDYGAVTDKALNRYIFDVGGNLSSRSHRPGLPYTFRAVNANYINAYAFPGGSIAATRGILLELENEAELAALMGHEIGHVNARHSAQRAGQSLIAGLVVAGAVAAVSSSKRGESYAPLLQIAGTVGASALLASYSRDNEREADSLGMEYMTRAGHRPDGMVGLMGVLVRQSKEKPGLLDTMFASHPMSSERFESMRAEAAGKYARFAGMPLQRERYMDHTASLRRLRRVIEEEQKGERAMAGKNFGQAEEHFRAALRAAPQDYTGLCLMAKCQISLQRYSQAREYVTRARQAYPGEAQAMQLSGVTQLALKDYAAAFRDFDAYEKALPGDPNAAFLKGMSQEAMRDRPAAAREYRRYLSIVSSGDQAMHASSRLKEWGYAR